MSLHPTVFDLQGFICGDLSEDLYWRVVAHLAEGCDGCLAEVAIQMNLILGAEEGADTLPEPVSRAYDEVIDRVFATVRRHASHAREEAELATKALNLLEEKGATGFVDAISEFGGVAGYWALLARLEALRFDNPKEMVKLAHLAVLIAEQLDQEELGAALVCNLRCRATIELSNAYRVADELREAEVLLGEAAELYKMCRPDLLLEARFLDVQASLLGDCRKFGAALPALDSLYATYLQNGDPHLAGRALIKKALYASYSGDPESGLCLVEQAMPLIDSHRDPSLMLLALHNQAFFLVECGRYREARTLLWQTAANYTVSMGQIQRFKFRWIEGRANLGLGQLDRAEQLLLEVKQGFEATGLLYKAALVTLELAMLALRRGYSMKAHALVMEAIEVFDALDLRREVLAAALLLRKAFETQTITLGLLEDMYKFLDRAETDPNLTLKTWLTDARQA